MNTISPKVQNQIAMLQQMQAQLQTIQTQKTQYDMAARETKRAIEELADVPEDGSVYMNIGTVMMQKKKGDVVTKLQEKVETLELRVKSLDKQEKMLAEKFEQLQAQIRQALEGRPPSAA